MEKTWASKCLGHEILTDLPNILTDGGGSLKYWGGGGFSIWEGFIRTLYMKHLQFIKEKKSS